MKNFIKLTILGICNLLLLKGLGLNWSQPIWWVGLLILSTGGVLIFCNSTENKEINTMSWDIGKGIIFNS